MCCFYNKANVAFALLLCVLLPHTINAQVLGPELEIRLGDYLQKTQDQKGFSGEILVAYKSDIVFQDVIGMASHELNVPLQVGMKYKIASISKTFTGSLVILAQEEDLLNIQDKASQYLKSLSGKFREITIEQLLNHTSGLPHNEAIKDYWQYKSRLSMDRESTMDEINKLEFLFEPGTKKKYSSLGYYLLACILEEVYDQDYLQVLEIKILKPFKLSNSGSANTLEIISKMTNGYHALPNDSMIKAPYRNYSMLKGAGDMYATTEDLLKWNLALNNNQLLSGTNTQELFTPKSPSVDYGFGWYVNHDRRTVYSHGGGTWGYSTHISFYPESKISIIILSNVSTLPMTSIAKQVEQLVFDKEVVLRTVQTTNLKTFALDKYTGVFQSESSGMSLDISLQSNELYAQPKGRPAFKISSTGGHAFFGKKIDIEMLFEVENGRITGLTAQRMNQEFRFKKQ